MPHFFRRGAKGRSDVDAAALRWVQLNLKLSDQLGKPEPYASEDLPSSILNPDDLRGTWHVYIAVKFYVGPTITSWWSHAAKSVHVPLQCRTVVQECPLSHHTRTQTHTRTHTHTHTYTRNTTHGLNFFAESCSFIS